MGNSSHRWAPRVEMCFSQAIQRKGDSFGWFQADFFSLLGDQLSNHGFVAYMQNMGFLTLVIKLLDGGTSMNGESEM